MKPFPLPGAVFLPDNKFSTPIVADLDGYADALKEAEDIGEYLSKLPVVGTPEPTPGPVNDKWQAAEDKRDADNERHSRWRTRAVGRQQNAIRQANAILHAQLDHVLRRLHYHLTETLLIATPDMKTLVAAGVDTADLAIENNLTTEWSNLAKTTWPDYQILRDTQDWLHVHIAPEGIWRSARAHATTFDSEEPASLLWMKNLPELWPDWRNRGRSRLEYRIDGSTPRAEPWPRSSGPEFLLWAHRAGAEHWIPDTKQYRDEFTTKAATFDEPAEETPAPTQQSWRGLPPPIMAQR